MISNDSSKETAPVVFTDVNEPQKVINLNNAAKKLGIRKGMAVDIIDYFCRGVILKIAEQQ